MTETNLHGLYQNVLDQVLKEDVRLPSMPDVAMKVRSAISIDSTSNETLTTIIARDPGLTAYLVRAASSPIYRRSAAPKTLSEVVGLLGFAATNSLVMIYSTRNMVEIKTEAAKKLFNHTWERLVVKTSVASFLAQQLKYRPVDQVQMAMLLTEVGSLAVLSAMLGTSETPDSAIYFQMCRQYSKQIGCAALAKWGVDQTIINVLSDCGNWDKTWDDKLNLLDIANLALYYTVRLTAENPELPDLESLAAYQKIPEKLNACSEPNWLDLVADNNDEIQAIISAFK
jgi:HD-like signal output (HDOD) protein